MKRVKGWVYCGPLGRHDFEFYVDDNYTDSEIKDKVLDIIDLVYDYDVDPGYIEKQEMVYVKGDCYD